MVVKDGGLACVLLIYEGLEGNELSAVYALQSSRRLKSLQTMEDRRLNLLNQQLSKEQEKASRQIELRRTQFQRRFSQHDLSHQNLREVAHVSTERTSRIKRHRSVPGTKRRNSLGEASQENTTVSLHPHFWLRLRSLGIMDDGQIPVPNITHKSSLQCMRCPKDVDFTERSDSGLQSPPIQCPVNSPAPTMDAIGSPAAIYMAGGSKVTFDFENKQSGRKTGSHLEISAEAPRKETKPTWLMALQRLREQKMLKKHLEQQGREFGARVCGCNFSSGTILEGTVLKQRSWLNRRRRRSITTKLCSNLQQDVSTIRLPTDCGRGERRTVAYIDTKAGLDSADYRVVSVEQVTPISSLSSSMRCTLTAVKELGKVYLENVEVLRRGLRSMSHRLIAEAVEITKHPNVNRMQGVELASVWRTVLDRSS
ncbi:hypothetical protein T265_01427 [Opisthorchis viverrini]|uniref:Uncharacterized protein n=1 Tax=Opisthorchis viverrini TaxID=6198 RepID=A0A074ZYL4_OPIVI|nr:hypothetical protein T265_01427 [Opisthorchis viverrini]KER32553.1 hypothetical protein T265_01427 [Opisthorchis viverrini]